MGNQRSIIIDVGVKLELEKQLTQLENQLSSLESIGKNAKLTKPLQDQLTNVKQEMAEIKSLIDNFGDSKIDVTAFKKFQEQIEGKIKDIRKDMNTITEQMRTLQQTVEGLSGGNFTKSLEAWKKKFDDVANSVKQTYDGISNLMQLANSQGFDFGFGGLKADTAELKKQLEYWKSIDKLTRNIGRWKNDDYQQSKNNDDIADIYKLEGNIKEAKKQIYDLSMAYLDAKDAYEDVSKDMVSGFVSGNDVDKALKKYIEAGKKMSAIAAQYNAIYGKQDKSPVDGIMDDLVLFDSFIDSIKQNIKDLNDQISSIPKENIKDIDTGVEKKVSDFKLRKGKIVVPVILNEDDLSKLYDKTVEIVEFINKKIEKNPVELNVRYVSGFKTKKRKELLDSMKKQIDSLEDGEIKDRFNELYQNISDRVSKEIRLDLQTNVDETEKNILDAIKNIREELEKGLEINPEIKITNENRQKIQDEIEKFSKDMSFDVVDHAKEMADHIKNALNPKQISQWLDALNSGLEKLMTDLNALKGVLYDQNPDEEDVIKKKETEYQIKALNTSLQTLISSLTEQLRNTPIGIDIIPDFNPQTFINTIESKLKNLSASINVVSNQSGGNPQYYPSSGGGAIAAYYPIQQGDTAQATAIFNDIRKDVDALAKSEHGLNKRYQDTIKALNSIVDKYQDYWKAGGTKSFYELGGDNLDVSEKLAQYYEKLLVSGATAKIEKQQVQAGTTTVVAGEVKINDTTPNGVAQVVRVDISSGNAQSTQEGSGSIQEVVDDSVEKVVGEIVGRTEQEVIETTRSLHDIQVEQHDVYADTLSSIRDKFMEKFFGDLINETSQTMMQRKLKLGTLKDYAKENEINLRQLTAKFFKDQLGSSGKYLGQFIKDIDLSELLIGHFKDNLSDIVSRNITQNDNIGKQLSSAIFEYVSSPKFKEAFQKIIEQQFNNDAILSAKKKYILSNSLSKNPDYFKDSQYDAYRGSEYFHKRAYDSASVFIDNNFDNIIKDVSFDDVTEDLRRDVAQSLVNQINKTIIAVRRTWLNENASLIDTKKVIDYIKPGIKESDTQATVKKKLLALVKKIDINSIVTKILENPNLDPKTIISESILQHAASEGEKLFDGKEIPEYISSFLKKISDIVFGEIKNNLSRIQTLAAQERYVKGTDLYSGASSLLKKGSIDNSTSVVKLGDTANSHKLSNVLTDGKYIDGKIVYNSSPSTYELQTFIPLINNDFAILKQLIEFQDVYKERLKTLNDIGYDDNQPEKVEASNLKLIISRIDNIIEFIHVNMPALEKMAIKIPSAIKEYNKLLDGSEKYTTQYSKVSGEIQDTEEKLSNAQKELSKAEKELSNISDKSSTEYKNKQEQITSLQNNISVFQANITSLKNQLPKITQMLAQINELIQLAKPFVETGTSLQLSNNALSDFKKTRFVSLDNVVDELANYLLTDYIPKRILTSVKMVSTKSGVRKEDSSGGEIQTTKRSTVRKAQNKEAKDFIDTFVMRKDKNTGKDTSIFMDLFNIKDVLREIVVNNMQVSLSDIKQRVSDNVTNAFSKRNRGEDIRKTFGADITKAVDELIERIYSYIVIYLDYIEDQAAQLKPQQDKKLEYEVNETVEKARKDRKTSRSILNKNARYKSYLDLNGEEPYVFARNEHGITKQYLPYTREQAEKTFSEEELKIILEYQKENKNHNEAMKEAHKQVESAQRLYQKAIERGTLEMEEQLAKQNLFFIDGSVKKLDPNKDADAIRTARESLLKRSKQAIEALAEEADKAVDNSEESWDKYNDYIQGFADEFLVVPENDVKETKQQTEKTNQAVKKISSETLSMTGIISTAEDSFEQMQDGAKEASKYSEMLDKELKKAYISLSKENRTGTSGGLSIERELLNRGFYVKNFEGTNFGNTFGNVGKRNAEKYQKYGEELDAKILEMRNNISSASKSSEIISDSMGLIAKTVDAQDNKINDAINKFAADDLKLSEMNEPEELLGNARPRSGLLGNARPVQSVRQAFTDVSNTTLSSVEDLAKTLVKKFSDALSKAINDTDFKVDIESIFGSTNKIQNIRSGFAEIIRLWNEAQQVMKETGSTLTERYMLFNKSTGYTTNPFASGNTGDVPSALINSAFNKAKKDNQSIDSMIHSHPSGGAIISKNDLLTFAKNRSKNIVNQYVLGDNKIASLNLANIGEDILKKVAEDYTFAVYDQLEKNFKSKSINREKLVEYLKSKFGKKYNGIIKAIENSKFTGLNWKGLEQEFIKQVSTQDKNKDKESIQTSAKNNTSFVKGLVAHFLSENGDARYTKIVEDSYNTALKQQLRKNGVKNANKVFKVQGIDEFEKENGEIVKSIQNSTSTYDDFLNALSSKSLNINGIKELSDAFNKVAESIGKIEEALTKVDFNNLVVTGKSVTKELTKQAGLDQAKALLEKDELENNLKEFANKSGEIVSVQSMEALSSGIVEAQVFIKEANGELKRYTYDTADGVKFLIRKIEDAEVSGKKYIQALEAMKRKQQDIARNTSYVQSDIKSGSAAWNQIVGMAKEKIGDNFSSYGDIEKITRQDRKDSQTGNLLESYLIETSSGSSITVGLDQQLVTIKEKVVDIRKAIDDYSKAIDEYIKINDKLEKDPNNKFLAQQHNVAEKRKNDSKAVIDNLRQAGLIGINQEIDDADAKLQAYNNTLSDTAKQSKATQASISAYKSSLTNLDKAIFDQESDSDKILHKIDLYVKQKNRLEGLVKAGKLTRQEFNEITSAEEKLGKEMQDVINRQGELEEQLKDASITQKLETQIKTIEGRFHQLGLTYEEAGKQTKILHDSLETIENKDGSKNIIDRTQALSAFNTEQERLNNILRQRALLSKSGIGAENIVDLRNIANQYSPDNTKLSFANYTDTYKELGTTIDQIDDLIKKAATSSGKELDDIEDKASALLFTADDLIKKLKEMQQHNSVDKITSDVDSVIKSLDKLRGKYGNTYDDALESAKQEIQDILSNYTGSENWDSVFDKIKNVRDDFMKTIKSGAGQIIGTLEQGEFKDFAENYIKKNYNKVIKELSGQSAIKDGLVTYKARVRDVAGEVQDLTFKWNAHSKNVVLDIKGIKQESTGLVGLIQQITSKAKGLFTYWTATKLDPYDFIRYFRTGIQYVQQYDDAMVEMRKVSNDTEMALQSFAKSSFNMANQVGTTGLQMQKSAADFMRLGESIEEAAKHAQEANILMNVSEFSDINEATDAFIQMTKAYKELDSLDVVNKLNVVGVCLNTQ